MALFRLQESLEQGRFLVAERDIEEGQSILTDTASVVGPFTVSVPICLACHVTLVPGSSPFCPQGCGFQLCANCSTSPLDENNEVNNKDWHQLECRTINQKSQEEEKRSPPNVTPVIYNKPNPAYSWVTPLRLLLLQKETFIVQNSNTVASDLKKLEHNTELRQKLDPTSWKLHEKYVVEPLHHKGWEKEEVRQALGVLLTNTLSIGIEGGYEIMGLFPQYAMLNHSCAHNTTTNISSDKKQFKVEVKAKRKIMRGEEITTRYLPILQGR